MRPVLDALRSDSEPSTVLVSEICVAPHAGADLFVVGDGAAVGVDDDEKEVLLGRHVRPVDPVAGVDGECEIEFRTVLSLNLQSTLELPRLRARHAEEHVWPRAVHPRGVVAVR